MFLTSCVLFQPGANCRTTTPGLTNGFYIAPINEVLCPPTVEEASRTTAPGDGVTISGPITMTNGGLGYYFIPFVEGTGEVVGSMTGSAGTGYTFDNSLVFDLRGITAENRDFLKRLAQCCEGFSILAQCKDKLEWLKIGDICSPAYLDPSQLQTGKVSGDKKSITITIKAMENCPPRSYDLTTEGLTVAPGAEPPIGNRLAAGINYKTDEDFNKLLPAVTAEKYCFLDFPDAVATIIATKIGRIEIATMTPQQAKLIVLSGYKYLVPVADKPAITSPKKSK